ncbi:Cof-type HAD-IIB family hydrolase [Paenibacillus xanthanilyticus]|uniref:Cof-type HAD-IIB family hydrolase n=1 Tax=Paenibacillus xanthanilyticus TaxID=1783531 RepID=A0ABV8K8K2_9BACL
MLSLPKLVLFDIDGTLLDHTHHIPASTKEAVALLQAAGIHTAIATGRTPSDFTWVREELGIRSYVSINGQYVVHEDDVIYENRMPVELLRELSAFADDAGHMTAYCGASKVCVSRPAEPHLTVGFSSVNLPYPEVDPHYYQHSPVYQGNIFMTAEEEARYITRFPSLRFIRWHEQAVDFLPVGSSKAAGIAYLLQAFGVTYEECAAFGDGLNDLEMLSAVGIGIAMGNGCPEAKEAANYVTASSSEHGIWSALQWLGLPQPAYPAR